MKPIKMFWILAIVTLTLPITKHKSLAGSLRLANNARINFNRVYYSAFDANNNDRPVQGYVQMNPIQSLGVGASNEFLEVLRNSFPEEQGWYFQNYTEPSDGGIFEISRYEPRIEIETSDYFNINYATDVGGNFVMNYTLPNGTQADPNIFHWIQRVQSNHSSITGIYGDPEDIIDVPTTQNNPFYDLIPNILSTGRGGQFFEDPPVRSNPYEPHDWFAELYLVGLIAEDGQPVAETDLGNPQIDKQVTIFNGISWGWKNRAFPQETQRFSDSLEAGETDTFRLSNLNVGSTYLAWIDNDRPENSCNPNTILLDTNSYNEDYDSSFLGDGFASALFSVVSSNGTIDLEVSGNGQSGEDRGNYNLYVKVYEPDETPDPELVALTASGGGGVILNSVSQPSIGRTQDNPILPNETDGDWQIFRNVPSCQWYDPPTPYGFEFQTLDDTLFTEIVDFPVGADDFFTVAVEGTILGEFSPGDSLNFVDLLGEGVDNFTITGIDSLFGSTPETAFPIRLAFDRNRGSFQMRPFSKSVPEPTLIFGLLTLTVLGWFGIKQDS